MNVLGYVLFVFFFIFIMYLAYRVWSGHIKIEINNVKYAGSLDCPHCGNKTQLVKMSIFDKPKYVCHICKWEEYWWLV